MSSRQRIKMMDRRRKVVESGRTEIERRGKISSRNQCVSPMPCSCLVCSYILTRWQRKKIRKIASSPPDSIDDEGPSTTHPPSPPQFTTEQKGKGQAIQNPLPTPIDTQQHPNRGRSHWPRRSSSQHKGRPGPNISAQRPRHQSEGTPQVPNQHHTRRQKDGQSSTSRQKRTTEKKWTRIAKFYGIYYCPWVLEERLTRVLQYDEGRELPEGDRDQELMGFLDELDVSDRDRKDSRFQANVSIAPGYWLWLSC